MEHFTQSERDELMATLAGAAEDEKPRLFALYGVNSGLSREILGWGIEWPDHGQAVYMQPPSSEVHLGGSAEQLHEGFSRIGDVRLVWLDHG